MFFSKFTTYIQEVSTVPNNVQGDYVEQDVYNGHEVFIHEIEPLAGSDTITTTKYTSPIMSKEVPKSSTLNGVSNRGILP